LAQDELLWGAAWLRRATQDESYINYVASNAHTLGADDNINEFGWDNKHAGLNVLVSRVGVTFDLFSLLDSNLHPHPHTCMYLLSFS